jgi:putative endonuclease
MFVVSASDRVSLGNRGETIACAELQRRGYAIVARQFRTRAGEIDIIARDGMTLVFVEVRTRASHDAGTAAESVTRRKRDQIGRMAAAYLGTHGTSPEPCRFDVVTVEFADGENPGDPIVTVYPSAFELGT